MEPELIRGVEERGPLEANFACFAAMAQRLTTEGGDVDQINSGVLIDAIRRANGNITAASQFYFGMRDSKAPPFANTLKEFREKTTELFRLYRPEWQLGPAEAFVIMGQQARSQKQHDRDIARQGKPPEPLP
jgi:hypothetical protein